MYVVLAVSEEVPPVAVTDFDPLFWSATIRLSEKEQDPTVLVWHETVERLADVKAVVATVTVSTAPKPLTLKVVDPRDSSGNPKLLPGKLSETFAVMLNDALTELTPSETLMVWAPPVIAGTVTLVWKPPLALVVRQVPVDIVLVVRLLAEPVPLPETVQLPGASQLTVVLPTVLVIEMGDAGLKPMPVMTRLEPTVPDVAAVSTPLEIVDRDTVGVAACTGEAGSRNTIPAIPARKSSPIVPNEASLLFGEICVCILFTIFVIARFQKIVYKSCGQMVYSEQKARSFSRKRAQDGCFDGTGMHPG